MKFAIFKGSKALDNAPEVLQSTLALADKLGITLEEIEEFSCSGESHLEDISEMFSILINARNLAYAQNRALDIVTISNVDFKVLKETKAKLDIDSNLKTKVNERLSKIGLNYNGKVNVYRFSDVLPKIEVTKALDEFFVACYRGENGADFSTTIQSLGANLVKFPLVDSPCGVDLVVRNKALATKLTGRVLIDAIDNGANSIVVGCASQYINLDLYQCSSAMRVGRDDIKIPIFYISQIIGLALDIPVAELGLNQNIAEVSI